MPSILDSDMMFRNTGLIIRKLTRDVNRDTKPFLKYFFYFFVIQAKPTERLLHYIEP